MNIRKKTWILVLVTTLLVASLAIFPGHPALVNYYDRFLYFPIQNIRMILLRFIPFSIGDILYVLGGFALLFTLIKWVKYILYLKQKWQLLLASALNLVNSAIIVYLFFLYGWGINYYKPSLRQSWKLHDTAQFATTDRKARFKRDSAALVAFDSLLVIRLNDYAPHFRSLPFGEVSDRAQTYYRQFTDSKVRKWGQGIKPSFFGFFLEHMAVEGYYNPFTGEGQVDIGQPGFMMPFLVCHEMAHQAGIAAEDDANLMAYTLGTLVTDSSFNYSSYLNLWLYTNNRLYRRDSVQALTFEARLNKLTSAHLDTLEQESRKYNNDVARYGTKMYDGYLKMQKQDQGIRTYGNVVTSAWQIELRRRTEKDTLIQLP